MAETHALGALAGGGEEHLGRARMGVLLEEVVLDLPHVLDPERGPRARSDRGRRRAAATRSCRPTVGEAGARRRCRTSHQQGLRTRLGVARPRKTADRSTHEPSLLGLFLAVTVPIPERTCQGGSPRWQPCARGGNRAPVLFLCAVGDRSRNGRSRKCLAEMGHRACRAVGEQPAAVARGTFGGGGGNEPARSFTCPGRVVPVDDGPVRPPLHTRPARRPGARRDDPGREDRHRGARGDIYLREREHRHPEPLHPDPDAAGRTERSRLRGHRCHPAAGVDRHRGDLRPLPRQRVRPGARRSGPRPGHRRRPGPGPQSRQGARQRAQPSRPSARIPTSPRSWPWPRSTAFSRMRSWPRPSITPPIPRRPPGRRSTSKLSLRAFEEVYAAPFRAAVQSGHVAAIMCAFGLINGVYACQSPAVLDILKEQLGFTRLRAVRRRSGHEPGRGLRRGNGHDQAASGKPRRRGHERRDPGQSPRRRGEADPHRHVRVRSHRPPAYRVAQDAGGDAPRSLGRPPGRRVVDRPAPQPVGDPAVAPGRSPVDRRHRQRCVDQSCHGRGRKCRRQAPATSSLPSAPSKAGSAATTQLTYSPATSANPDRDTACRRPILHRRHRAQLRRRPRRPAPRRRRQLSRRPPFHLRPRRPPRPSPAPAGRTRARPSFPSSPAPTRSRSRPRATAGCTSTANCCSPIAASRAACPAQPR